jgi:hypothetical protein
MLRAEWTPYVLDFLFLARTSRSDMRQKSTYFIKIYDDALMTRPTTNTYSTDIATTSTH